MYIRQSKISFIEQLQDFEEKHLPVEKDGKLVYPTDPQNFNPKVKNGIGELYFALDQFDDWFCKTTKKGIPENHQKSMPLMPRGVGSQVWFLLFSGVVQMWFLAPKPHLNHT